MTRPSSATRLGSRWRWWLWWPLLLTLAWLMAQEQENYSNDALPASPAILATRLANNNLPETPKKTYGSSLAPIAREQLLVSAGATRQARDLFSSRQPAPAPSPATPPASEQPTAPALPLRYVGKQWNGEAWEVYAVSGQQTYVLREGMTLDEHYRVERIAPPHVVLTYLPLGMEQRLSMGDTR